MADNVDISLKLGTEADISSAINAGARAGAAFAAAAQAAVGGLSLSTSASMRAFTTSTRQISSSADVANEIRRLGITNGLIAQMAIQGSRGGNGGNGGWGSKPFAPIFPDPRGGNNLPQNQWRFTYSGWKQIQGNTPEVIDAEWYEKTEKSITNIDKLITRAYGRGGGKGGGGGPLLLEDKSGPYYQLTENDIIPFKSKFMTGLGWGKLAQQAARPLADYFVATNLAEYQAKTARSARGYREEAVAKELAFIDLESKLGGKGAALSLTAAGAAFGGIPGAIAGGIVGGIAELFLNAVGEDTKNRLKESVKQQEKSLSESLKRTQNNYLYGHDYNTSYQEAIGNMGIGITEDSISQLSSNALTFRGRQAFGQVGIHEYTMLAQVPHYFQALEAGITDPEVLHKLLAADLSNIGDPSYAAYIASQLGGVGLGTYSALQNPAYWYATNSVNSRVMKGSNIKANTVVEGYAWRNAKNQVISTEATASEMVQDAYGRPIDYGAAGKLLGWDAKANTVLSSMYYNGPRPTKAQYDESVKSTEAVREAALRNDVDFTGNTYVINVNVDGENTQTVQFKERDLIMSGQTYMVGGN